MPVSTSPEWAWDTAERRCFEYLLTVLGAIEGVEGYRAELPRTGNRNGAELNQWSFSISGGSNVIIPEPETRGNVSSWHNEALFEGRFVSRQLALRTIGLLRGCTPAGINNSGGSLYPAIEGVQKLYIATHPTVTQATVELGSDQSTGGQIRCWSVTVPMAVAYNNQEQIT